MILGLANSLVTLGKLGGFTPADATGVLGWWRSQDGVFKAGPAPAGDGETVATWVDSINGLTLTRTAASSALVLDSDGAPNASPAIIGTGGALARTFAAPLASPWIAAVVRLDWAGAASLIVDSSATNRYFASRYTSTLLSINSGTTVNNNAVVDSEWGLLIIDWGTDGVFNWSGQLEKVLNTGSNANAGFVFGRAYNDISPTNFAVADLIIGDGTLTRADRINLRAWASRKYGFAFPSDTEFLDTFNRPDTGPTIGTSDSGHTWPTLQADTRILDNKLTYISPWATVYASPPINFVPRTFDIDFSTRAGGGGGASTSGYILIGTAAGDYDPSFHFSFTNTGWAAQEFESGGVVNVEVVSGKDYDGSGNFRLSLNYDAGTVTVTDPEGTITVVDWDGSGIPARNLSAYETPYVFYELAGNGSTNALIYEFDRISMRP